MFLVITHDTFLKKSKEMSLTLTKSQKKRVNKLEELPEVKAFRREGNHYIVTFSKNLKSESEEREYNTWYIFSNHCYLVKDKLLKDILETYLKKEYFIIENGINICGVENTDSINENDNFNDQIILFKFEERVGLIVGKYKATTQAGKYYTEKPLNKKGAAKLAYGQFTSWIIGLHKGRYEALVQLKPVKVHRDGNKNYQVDKEDYCEEGYFGINIHHAYSSSNIGKYSAGCQVIQSITDFNNFLKTIKQDYNYQKNKSYIFTYCLLNSRDFNS